MYHLSVILTFRSSHFVSVRVKCDDSALVPEIVAAETEVETTSVPSKCDKNSGKYISQLTGPE